jgi:hypothetical protein
MERLPNIPGKFQEFVLFYLQCKGQGCSLTVEDTEILWVLSKTDIEVSHLYVFTQNLWVTKQKVPKNLKSLYTKFQKQVR